MSTAQILCPGCSAPLASVIINTEGPEPCPQCGRRVIAAAFPALLRPVAEGRAAEKVVMPDEAACFYHPAKKAAVPCGSCGRFLCALCDIDIDGQHICPGCLDSGTNKGKMEKLETSKFRYDKIALHVAIVPLIIFFFTLVTAPIALYLCIRYWNTPVSIAKRSRALFISAAIIASLEIAGWAIFFLYLAR